MAKYRTFVNQHPKMKLVCIKDVTYPYYKSSLDYKARVVKPEYAVWKKGESTIVPIFLGGVATSIIEGTKDWNEALSILTKSTFPIEYYVGDQKKVLQFQNKFFQLQGIQASSSEVKVVQMLDEKKVNEENNNLVLQCANSFNVLSAIAKKDMNAAQLDDFKRRVYAYRLLVEEAQSIEGLQLKVEEFDLATSKVRVTLPNKKTVFVKPKPKPKPKPKAKKKKVSGYEDGPEEIGVIPVFAYLIIAALFVGGGVYVATDYIKKRAQIKKIAEGFKAQAENNKLLLEVAKAETAGTITPTQANVIKTQIEKSNAAAAEVIATNSPTEKKSMFDDVQTTILYAGAALIAYNLTKK